MPTFTRPDGSTIDVDASEIARARPTIPREIFGKPDHIGTALFKPKQLVLEAIEVVGPALMVEVPSFAELHAPNNASIWFEATKARDAEAPRASETSPNTNAVVVMGGVRQRVSETVAQAQAVIDNARLG
ncbi:hypothetical protein ACOTTU_17085 [Roseobacter sp. EG26]|uniref:hypothetical protein n=1 Tax=Roseobacter sp. EG26 TaxID=3412477 RepID=UPI003CE51A0A